MYHVEKRHELAKRNNRSWLRSGWAICDDAGEVVVVNAGRTDEHEEVYRLKSAAEEQCAFMNVKASEARGFVSERSAAATASLKSAVPQSSALYTESAERMAERYCTSAQIFRSAIWKAAHDYENSKSKTDQRLGHVLIALGYALDELNGQTDIDLINTQVERYIEQNWKR